MPTLVAEVVKSCQSTFQANLTPVNESLNVSFAQFMKDQKAAITDFLHENTQKIENIADTVSIIRQKLNNSQIVGDRGGVEDTRLEAKDTKKNRGQGQGQPFRGQTLSRPRTGMLEAKAKDQGHKRKCSPKSQKFFRRSPKKKKRSSQKFFYRSPQKNVFQKIFQALQKILAIQKIVLSSRPRTSSRTPPLVGDLADKSEKEDRNRRRNNLIMFNLPESDDGSANDQMMQDCSKFLKLMDGAIKLTQDQVVKIFRLGKKEAEKKRPLLVK